VQEPLRVLFSFPTRLGTTGIGTTAWNQVSGLVALGVDVTLVCGSIERPVPGARVHAETMRIGGVRVPYRLVGFDRAVTHHDRRAARAVRALAGRIDVVHAWPLGGERSLTAARRHGITALLERPNAHTAFAFEAVAEECRRIGVPVGADSPHAFDARRLAREEREYASADALLCPSEFVARTHFDRGIPRERLLRHRYGYDPLRFSPGPPRDPGSPLSVVFVGLGEPRKGLHTALQAWLDAGLGDDGRFLICGSIEPAYRDVLAPMLAHPSVQELGHVSDPGAVMRDCDVLVLPSVEEGSALVTYEGRASGCVLAVSDRSGAPCRHDYDGLVHRAGATDELQAHFQALARDPQLLARLRAASLAGLDELTWSAAARALLDAYRAGIASRAEASAPALASG